MFPRLPTEGYLFTPGSTAASSPGGPGSNVQAIPSPSTCARRLYLDFWSAAIFANPPPNGN